LYLKVIRALFLGLSPVILFAWVKRATENYNILLKLDLSVEGVIFVVKSLNSQLAADLFFLTVLLVTGALFVQLHSVFTEKLETLEKVQQKSTRKKKRFYHRRIGALNDEA